MKSEIRDLLHKLESDYSINIVLATHTGGRQVGIYHQNSDVDIAILYYPEKVEERNQNDINIHLNDVDIAARNIISQLQYYKLIYNNINQNMEIDMSSINKAYRPFVYIKAPQIVESEFVMNSMQCFNNIFHPKIALLFYADKAKLNYDNIYVDNSESVINVRSLLFYIRSVLSLKWVLENESIPPTTLQELIDICEYDLYKNIILQYIKDYRNSMDRDMTSSTNGVMNSYFKTIQDGVTNTHKFYSSNAIYEVEEIEKIIMYAKKYKMEL